ncbi:MAG: hypothetical protein KAW12_22550 [Candidatus Aminicenantes bacterium]|nr:hypothetical protein [Candidatus Aminicenantes bacterium]
MDEKKFRAVEARHKILSGQHKRGEIDSDTLKKELKKIMLQGEDGKYWMIGGKTGKWYVYDGKAWNEKSPFKEPAAAPPPPPAPAASSAQEQRAGSIEPAVPASRDTGSEPDYSTVVMDQSPIKQEGRIERDFSAIRNDASGGTDAGAASAADDVFGTAAGEGSGAVIVDAMPAAGGAAGSTGTDDLFGAGAGEASGAVIVDAMAALKKEESSAAAVENFSAAQDSSSFEIEGFGDSQDNISAGVDAFAAGQEGGAEAAAVIETGRAESTTIDLDGVEGSGEAAGLGGFEVVSTQEDELAAATPEAAGAGAFDPSPAAGAAAGTFAAAMEDSSTVRVDAIPAAAPGPVRDYEAQPKGAPVTGKFDRGDQLVISAVNMVSLMFFLGGVGLIIGVLFGATFGIFTGVFDSLIDRFPEMLKNAQGGLAGGLIFAAIGGIAGFIFFGIMGAVMSTVYNIIASVFGGIRVKIK